MISPVISYCRRQTIKHQPQLHPQNPPTDCNRKNSAHIYTFSGNLCKKAVNEKRKGEQKKWKIISIQTVTANGM